MSPTLFSDLAELCEALEATKKRKEKSRILAEFLIKLDTEEIAPSVLLIVGSIFPEFDQRTLDVGWSTMKRVLERMRQTTLIDEPLTIKRVHEILKEIAETKGTGSRRLKEGLLKRLVDNASSRELEIILRIISGEMRIGVNEGMMLEGIAEAAATDLENVRRALMLTGDLGQVAKIAIEGGVEGLRTIKAKMFMPLKPMLASMSYMISEVIEEHGGRTALEYKFDGGRIQIHRRGNNIRIFSRRLSDITDSFPDIVEAIEHHIDSEEVILEGEAVAVGEGERPLPFQDLMRRFTRVHEVKKMAEKIPIRLHLFDVLYINGLLLVDETYEKRWKILSGICPQKFLAKRLITGNASEAESFLRQAILEGHEGLMAKRLDSRYIPGIRGNDWLKIKPTETLDLVIVAADWGYGRRTGWLSNYHLGALDIDEYKIIGKTFKGLTDEEFIQMTQKLKELKVRETTNTVFVSPKIVVEVAFNEIQRSPHYPSGYALRFARVKRIRKDKNPADADTLDRVKELYDKQFRYKAKIDLD